MVLVGAYDYRDSMTLATAVNDLAAVQGQKLPFHQMGMAYLCRQLGVENLAHHDALNDAIVCGRLYRKLLDTMEDFTL